MCADTPTAIYTVIETATFRSSAAKYYVASEIFDLCNVILRDPFLGTPLRSDTEALLKVRHPEEGATSQKGFKPIVIYCADENEREVVFIDVVESKGGLDEWLANEENANKVVRYGRLIVRIIVGAFSEA